MFCEDVISAPATGRHKFYTNLTFITGLIQLFLIKLFAANLGDGLHVFLDFSTLLGLQAAMATEYAYFQEHLVLRLDAFADVWPGNAGNLNAFHRSIFIQVTVFLLPVIYLANRIRQGPVIRPFVVDSHEYLIEKILHVEGE